MIITTEQIEKLTKECIGEYINESKLGEHKPLYNSFLHKIVGAFMTGEIIGSYGDEFDTKMSNSPEYKSHLPKSIDKLKKALHKAGRTRNTRRVLDRFTNYYVKQIIKTNPQLSDARISVEGDLIALMKHMKYYEMEPEKSLQSHIRNYLEHLAGE